MHEMTRYNFLRKVNNSQLSQKSQQKMTKNSTLVESSKFAHETKKYEIYDKNDEKLV